jgi:hypothetical protein
MSKILALAAELKSIRRNGKQKTNSKSRATSLYGNAFNQNVTYDFEGAYAALHAGGDLAHQHSYDYSYGYDGTTWSRGLDGELVFQTLVATNRDQFVQRVREISSQLQINPNWLMAVMRFESRLNPQAVNRVSRATGLIQFMPSTARGLGTTVEALAQMSNIQQLDFVMRYYHPFRGRMRNYLDCYLVTFYPAAIGRPESFVLGSERSAQRVRLIADQNPGMDGNRDGQVTLAEVHARIYSRLRPEEAALINLPYTP